MPSSILLRLKSLLFRRSTETELDEELGYHLHREIERNIANGMAPDEARDAARRAFGNLTSVTEAAREAWQWPGLEAARQDVLYAFRSFRRAPLYAVTVVATIGLALGLLSSAFTFFDAYVLRPMPVRDPRSLYELSWSSASGRKHRFSPPQLEAIRAGSPTFSEAFAFEYVQAKLRGRPTLGQEVSTNYFAMLGVPAAIGRPLVQGDSDLAAPRTIVLSHHIWRSVFAGDSSVVGATIDVNGHPTTVVGIAREGFGGLTNSPYDFWIPLRGATAAGSRDRESFLVITRLAKAVSEDVARAAFGSVMRAATSDLPRGERAGGVTLIARGTAFPRTPDTVAVFGPVIIAFGLILLIACANVMNIMLARGVARQREIGIRITLGAGRARIVRQLVTEALLLSAGAGIVGFLVSRTAIAVVLSLMFATVPSAYAGFLRVIPLNVDWIVVAFLIVCCVATALLFGLAPALQATRPNLVQASRGDFDTQFRPMRLKNGLVVAQVALSVLLLICAGVLLSAARDTRRIDPGIRVEGVVQLQLLDSMQAQTIELLRGRPEIRAMASSSSTPLDGSFNEVAVSAGKGARERVAYMVASPGYFDVLDLPLRIGRRFTDEEARDRAPVVVVSESAARRLWPNRNPIGELLTIPPGDHDYNYLKSYHTARVIGITRDAVPGWIGRGHDSPIVYYPLPLTADMNRLLVRVDGDASVAVSRIERLLENVHPSPIVEMHTLEESLALQVYPFQALYWVASALGLIALTLTVTGVYGLLSYVVSQRQKEFGVRMALGAGQPAVVGLVLKQSARLSIVGIGIGVMLALAVSRLFAGLIINVRTFDPFGYAAGIVLVFTTCVAAAYAPSVRAANVNPADAMRDS